MLLEDVEIGDEVATPAVGHSIIVTGMTKDFKGFLNQGSISCDDVIWYDASTSQSTFGGGAKTVVISRCAPVKNCTLVKKNPNSTKAPPANPPAAPQLNVSINLTPTPLQPIPLPGITIKSLPKTTCTCPSIDLFNGHCKCGYLQQKAKP